MRKIALRATALLTALVLSAHLGAPSSEAANPPKGAAARRNSWLYNNGSIRKTNAKNWVEQNVKSKSTFTFREVARTPQYVTLYDRTRKMHVRIYNSTVYSYSAAKKQWSFLYQGRWADPYKWPLNQDRFPDERGKLAAQTERKAFPHLGRQFEVLAPATPNYNCIAWAVGVTREWVWPTTGGRNPTVADFDRLLAQHGYRRATGLNFDYQSGVEKIVLYGKGKAGSWEPTHAARQLSDGSWSSKLGCLPLVRHLEPNDLDGSTYGAPIAVYVRTKTSVARR